MLMTIKFNVNWSLVMLAKPYSKLTVLSQDILNMFPVGNTFQLVSVVSLISLSANQYQVFF